MRPDRWADRGDRASVGSIHEDERRRPRAAAQYRDGAARERALAREDTARALRATTRTGYENWRVSAIHARGRAIQLDTIAEGLDPKETT